MLRLRTGNRDGNFPPYPGKMSSSDRSAGPIFSATDFFARENRLRKIGKMQNSVAKSLATVNARPGIDLPMAPRDLSNPHHKLITMSNVL